jgi:hypothetical protein
VGLNDTAKNTGLTAIAAAITHFGLNTDVVGSGTTNEVTGGSPAYARKAASWAAAASGSIATNTSPVFDIPAGTTVRRVTFHGASTGTANYQGDAELTDEVFAAQGTYTLNTGSTISITG